MVKNNKKNTEIEKYEVEQKTIFTEIEKIIKNIKKIIKENGDIDKVAVRNAVSNLDEELLNELLKNKDVRKEYFNQVGNLWVFNQNKFIDLFDSVKFLGDSYTKFKADIGLIDANEKFIVDNDDVVLSFPFKDCMLEFDSTDVDDKREEYFINERIAKDRIDVMLEPKVFVNCKKIDKNGESKKSNCEKFDIEKDNLIVKGNNLLAMYSLLPRYEGKIKLMYWDILYNTESDHVPYADSFKHSSWLVMMKNRLEVAKKLLKDDGVICLQCDDNEMAYLKVLCDEIFERNNFMNCIAIKMSEASNVKMAHAKKRFPKLKEYILVYKMKNFNEFVTIDKYVSNEWDAENNIFLENFTRDDRKKLIKIEEKDIKEENDIKEVNKILSNVRKISLANKFDELKIKNEEKKEWSFNNSYRIIKTAGSSSLAKLVKMLGKIPKQDIASSLSKEGILYYYITDFNRNVKQPRLQVIFADSNLYKNPCDFWQDIKTTGAISDEGGVQLPNGKKPEKILYRLIKMITNKNDLILDAYFGTGTTGAVAMKMGRRFIGIEQLDDHFENKAKVRLKNVINGDETGISKLPEVNWKGGGSFISVELAKLNDNFIEEINKIDKKNEKKLFDVYNRIIKNPYLNCYVDVNKLVDQTNKFNKLSFTEKKKILIQLLDKNQLYVNYMDMNDKEFKISDIDKKFTKNFYNGKE